MFGLGKVRFRSSSERSNAEVVVHGVRAAGVPEIPDRKATFTRLTRADVSLQRRLGQRQQDCVLYVRRGASRAIADPSFNCPAVSQLKRSMLFAISVLPDVGPDPSPTPVWAW